MCPQMCHLKLNAVIGSILKLQIYLDHTRQQKISTKAGMSVFLHAVIGSSNNALREVIPLAPTLAPSGVVLGGFRIKTEAFTYRTSYFSNVSTVVSFEIECVSGQYILLESGFWLLCIHFHVANILRSYSST